MILHNFTCTAYAPLDPKAKKGMDYSGNPSVTASGTLFNHHFTIAAPSYIPFGSWVYIETVGWRRVDDRGGKIKRRRLDIGMRTRKEAKQFGVRKLKVWVDPHIKVPR
jgi:3D (Asp-Asp-Asp) domain-containing protein